MTTLLPQQDTAMLRAIARTASVLLVCLRIDAAHSGRAIADFEIADILEQDVRTVRKHLRSLSAAGMVLGVRGRWVVTLAGRNSLFGRGQAGGEEEAGEVVEEEDAQPKLAEPAVVIDNEKYTQNVYYEKNAQNVPQDLEEEEERVFLIDSDSSSSSMRAICASTEQILRATCLLFGSAVTVNAEILSRDPRHALCWVAKAWADRAGLAAPQGLIYKRLAGRVTPPLYLLRDPMQGLPNNYLVAIGMAEVEAVPGKVCWRCMRNPCQCEEEADE